MLDGIELIQNLIEFLPISKKNEKLKLVIFVDDLDRTTPEKAAEIFESIKVFFDIEGIVFILGLSKDVVESAINIKYEKFKKVFDAEDYLKKVIQVPFALPVWTREDISSYLEDLLTVEKSGKHSEFFTNHLELISEGIPNNPREVKRLLNNFILTYEIINNSEINKKKLLILQILAIRWRKAYDRILNNPSVLTPLQSRISPETKRQILDSFGLLVSKISPVSTDVSQSSSESIDSVENSDLIVFLKGVGKDIFEINDDEWAQYRRASIIEPDISFSKPLDNQTTMNIEVTKDKVWISGIVNSTSKILENGPSIQHLKSDGSGGTITASSGEPSFIWDGTFYKTFVHLNNLKDISDSISFRLWSGNGAKGEILIEKNVKLRDLNEDFKIKMISEEKVPLTSKESTFAREKIYPSLYDKMVTLSNQQDKFQRIIENPWNELPPSSKIQIDENIKNLFEKFSDELSKWNNTLSKLDSKYVINQKHLGNIIGNAFSNESLLKNDGHIGLDATTSMEPKHWLDAFRFIIFDYTITDDSILYQKLIAHSISTQNGHQKWLENWKQNQPGIFKQIFTVISELRHQLVLDVSLKNLDDEKNMLDRTIKKIISKLEVKLPKS